MDFFFCRDFLQCSCYSSIYFVLQFVYMCFKYLYKYYSVLALFMYPDDREISLLSFRSNPRIYFRIFFIRLYLIRMDKRWRKVYSSG